jgi:hypothetical protein
MPPQSCRVAFMVDENVYIDDNNVFLLIQFCFIYQLNYFIQKKMIQSLQNEKMGEQTDEGWKRLIG